MMPGASVPGSGADVNRRKADIRIAPLVSRAVGLAQRLADSRLGLASVLVRKPLIALYVALGGDQSVGQILIAGGLAR